MLPKIAAAVLGGVAVGLSARAIADRNQHNKEEQSKALLEQRRKSEAEAKQNRDAHIASPDPEGKNKASIHETLRKILIISTDN